MNQGFTLGVVEFRGLDSGGQGGVFGFSTSAAYKSHQTCGLAALNLKLKVIKQSLMASLKPYIPQHKPVLASTVEIIYPYLILLN